MTESEYLDNTQISYPHNRRLWVKVILLVIVLCLLGALLLVDSFQRQVNQFTDGLMMQWFEFGASQPTSARSSDATDIADTASITGVVTGARSGGGSGGDSLVQNEPSTAAVNNSASRDPLTSPTRLAQSSVLPRYMVLRYAKSNLRRGPGYEFPIDWVFTKPFLPVEVLRTYREWVYVQDFDETKGWVHRRLLQNGYAGQVIQNNALLTTYPHRDPQRTGAYAILERGVAVRIKTCNNGFCDVKVVSHDGRLMQGWIPQEALWGSLPIDG